MICPKCIEEGKKSVVTQGHTTNTLAYQPAQWDEDGHIMPFRGKTSTTYYSCSNGHAWSKLS